MQDMQYGMEMSEKKVDIMNVTDEQAVFDVVTKDMKVAAIIFISMSFAMAVYIIYEYIRSKMMRGEKNENNNNNRVRDAEHARSN